MELGTRARRLGRRSVERVADDGGPALGEVHPKLMRAPRRWLGEHERCILARPKPEKAGVTGPTTGPRCVVEREAEPGGVQDAREKPPHLPTLLSGSGGYEREVSPQRTPGSELAAKARGALAIAREEHDTARLPVEAMQRRERLATKTRSQHCLQREALAGACPLHRGPRRLVDGHHTRGVEQQRVLFERERRRLGGKGVDDDCGVGRHLFGKRRCAAGTAREMHAAMPEHTCDPLVAKAGLAEPRLEIAEESLPRATAIGHP
ncbi:MAG TPA: hypothetical protein VEG67_00915, partial [Myxococcota bacterium]|nr:hypothetical protein [Myxococcota bacterium]